MPLPPLVLLAEPLPPEPTNWLGERCRVHLVRPDEHGFAAALAEASALVVRTGTVVDEALLDRAPALRVVGRAGVGVESIDVDACRRRGIEVVHTPDANSQAVVEYVLWLIGDALRPRAALHAAIDQREWERTRSELTAKRQLSECTVGIFGMGRIGGRLNAALAALGVPRCYCDLREIAATSRHDAEPVSPERLFEASDIVTVHIDGRPSNRRIVGASLLERMKPDALLINTARGMLIDHNALASVLRDRPTMLALLDVHDPEPIRADHPLFELANAHLFPHLASRTESAVRDMGWVVRDVVTVLEGGTPRHAAPDHD